MLAAMAKDEVGGGAVLLAFVAGAIAGAAVAPPFAPATGDETREFIAQTGTRGRGMKRASSSASGHARDATRSSTPHVSSALRRSQKRDESLPGDHCHRRGDHGGHPGCGDRICN